MQMRFAKFEEKINIPLFQERERVRKREQESNKGHYQLLLHFTMIMDNCFIWKFFQVIL